jgi:hypothetical protein
MKNRKKGPGLPLAMVVLGNFAMVLRRQLYVNAVDHKGLLLRGTTLEILLLALTGVALALIFLGLKNDRGGYGYEENFSASVPAGLGHVAAATGIFTMVRGTVFGMPGYMGLLWQLLGMAAPVCLVLAGILRILGKKPFFLLHVIPCLFLLVQTVGNYQLWSSNPQMQDYLFALLSVSALVLFSYYTAAFEADLGERRLVRSTGLAAIYLCLAELGYTADPAMYWGCMLWVLTSLWSMTPVTEYEDSDE